MPPYRHEEKLHGVASMGFEGLEVAPSRVWRKTDEGLAFSEVQAYRKKVESAGLRVVGLHSLTFDHPELALFESEELRGGLLSFLIHMAKICIDLGGYSLVFGSPQSRRRGAMDADEARRIAMDFFSELAARTDSLPVAFCLEPLSPAETDFVCSARSAIAMAVEIEHPNFRVQLDAKSLCACAEMDEDLFREAAPYLVHFHANDPGLVELGSTGKMNHGHLGSLLRGVGYTGYVSLEQKMLSERQPLEPLRRSVSVMKECYL
ncbi:MAG: sugar phosphate isomerase/epimerase [Nitrospirae bacterium]|nr:sugar phosphate isomerase/epimerase [Nitrospirota bacterium]